MKPGRVIVIGGGAAGMLAAGSAAEAGADVVVLEKGPILGRKLRISGKGRCNLTNTAQVQDFVEAFGPNGRFLYGAFSRFFRDDLTGLLDRLGVRTKVERGGRVFPVSDRASDVADALAAWLSELGVKVRLNMAAQGLAVEDGQVAGVDVFGGRTPAAAVVVATGGASYPWTGSTGDGWTMARAIGHTVIDPEPGLSPMVVRESWARDMQGLSLRNVEAALLVRDTADAAWRRIDSEFGEMLFTHFGISGPIVLTLSRAARAYLGKCEVAVSLDLKPALSAEQLHARLVRDFVRPRKFGAYARTLLPRLMASAFVELSGIDPDKTVNNITSAERARIVGLLKDVRMTVECLRPIEEAIVTAGGVAISEIDPRTMMSRIVPGVFFAGETIDIDARTGGFNLQAAFSTGYVAGRGAADFARRRACD